MPIVRKIAKDTVTAVELNRGETLQFTLRSGRVWSMELLATSAAITETNLKQIKVKEKAGKTNYHFDCRVKVNGQELLLQREVTTPKSFYQPWLIDGVNVWFDAVDDIFEFLNEKHGECRPRAHARFALQDATLGICPEPVHPWCPLPAEGLKIEMCYTGEDVWLGAYQCADAHGGLDINHPPGTPLWAPIDIHDHFYFNSVEMGHNNNRWRGIHHWANGSQWVLQAHHMTRLTVAEHVPIRKGEQFADGAGVLSGVVDHSHFVFKVHDEGQTILLDPWILFWQMYRDRAHFPARW